MQHKTDHVQFLCVSLFLSQSNDMLNVLRASRFKIMAAKAFVDKQEKPDDDIANYIEFDKSKQVRTFHQVLHILQLFCLFW